MSKPEPDTPLEVDESAEISEDTFTPLQWEGGHVDASDVLLERGAAYGMYVNTMRALPDIRDGMKSVQRRVIFGMAQQQMFYNKKPKKSAQAVGFVMGKYHPHGDSSIYEALVRMAQSFTFQVPLVHGQGNFGTVDGDSPAAMRYTEVKLSQASSEFITDLREEVVEYRDNFSEDAREPTVLPVTFPNLLVNGSQGIGWSLACNVPTHNLQEVIDAALLIADKPDATIKQICRRLPGPDYPTGGIIPNPEALDECYVTGRGTFALQAKYHIENMSGNQQAVVVTELPYQVGPSQVLQEIIDGAKNEKISEVTEKPVNNLSRKGLRLVVKCKRGGNVQALVAQLMKYTSLQATQKVNFTVLVDGIPKTVSLREILHAFVEFRREIVTKRLEYERAKLLRELSRYLALRAALDVIDQIIKIIRESKDDNDTRGRLMKLVKMVPYGETKKVAIDERQAQHIMDMPLKQLNQLNRFELEEKIKVRELRIKEIDEILGDPTQITEILKDELKEVRKRYGHERTTLLAGAAGDSGTEPTGVTSIPKTDVTIFASTSGQAIAFERGKLKNIPLSMGGQDSLAAITSTDTEAALHVYTAQGICYRARAGDLGIDSKKGKGRPLSGMGKNDHLVGLLPIDAAPYLVFVTRNGSVKRLESEVLAGSHAGGISAMRTDEDRIVSVIGHQAGSELVVHTATGKVLRTALDAIRPVKSGNAGGVALMKLGEGDYIVSAHLARGDDLMILHQNGHAKRVSLSDIPSKGRGGGGVTSALVHKPAKTPSGPVAISLDLPDKGELAIITNKGKMNILPISSLTPSARAGISKPWLDIEPGNEWPVYACVLGGS